MQTGTGQVLDGSSRVLNIASWQSTSKPRSGKGTQTCSDFSVRHFCQETWERTLSRMASRQNGVRDQASHSRKQQTARSHDILCTIQTHKRFKRTLFITFITRHCHLSTGQENNIAQPKTDEWFSCSFHFFIVVDRLAVVKCRFVAWQRVLPRNFAGVVLINSVLLNLLCLGLVLER